jgi:hypothetical protein
MDHAVVLVEGDRDGGPFDLLIESTSATVSGLT